MSYTLFTSATAADLATKTDKYQTQAKTANFTAAPGFVYLIDSTAGAVTATLPAANSAGQQVVFKWAAGTNTATVQRAGSDTIGAAATTAVLALDNEVWEFTSSGSGQWNLTAGNKTLSSLDGRYAGNQLTTGEETLGREFLTGSTITITSGLLKLSYFTARKTESVSQMRLYTGTTAAAATPTLCRLGVYEIAANGDGTLVASTANDTSLFAGANTAYTRSFTTPFTKVAGRRYAAALIVVSAAATPNFAGQIHVFAVEITVSPPLTAQISAQTDLPSTFTAGSLQNSSTRVYQVLLP